MTRLLKKDVKNQSRFVGPPDHPPGAGETPAGPPDHPAGAGETPAGSPDHPPGAGETHAPRGGRGDSPCLLISIFLKVMQLPSPKFQHPRSHQFYTYFQNKIEDVDSRSEMT